MIRAIPLIPSSTSNESDKQNKIIESLQKEIIALKSAARFVWNLLLIKENQDNNEVFSYTYSSLSEAMEGAFRLAMKHSIELGVPHIAEDVVTFCKRDGCILVCHRDIVNHNEGWSVTFAG